MPMTPESFVAHAGSVLATIADAGMQTSTRVTKCDDWLVRLNLIAHGDYRLCCAASRDISGARLSRFIDETDRVLAEGLFQGADWAEDFLASRRAGYLHAEKDKSNQAAIVNYFRACCGSDDVLIGYDRITLPPKEIRRIIDRFGPLPGAVAALARADEIEDPVYFPIDPLGDNEIFGTLAASAKAVFDVWRRAIHE